MPNLFVSNNKFLGWRDVEFLTKCLETAINDGGDLGMFLDYLTVNIHLDIYRLMIVLFARK